MGTSITGTYKMKRTMIFRIKMSDKMSDQMISDQLLNVRNWSIEVYYRESIPKDW